MKADNGSEGEGEYPSKRHKSNYVTTNYAFSKSSHKNTSAPPQLGTLNGEEDTHLKASGAHSREIGEMGKALFEQTAGPDYSQRMIRHFPSQQRGKKIDKHVAAKFLRGAPTGKSEYFNNIEDDEEDQDVDLSDNVDDDTDEDTGDDWVDDHKYSQQNHHRQQHNQKHGNKKRTKRSIEGPSDGIRKKATSIIKKHNVAAGFLRSSIMSGHRINSEIQSHTSPPSTLGTPAKSGLRHFAMKICEKVKSKGVTTYNEVADDLVHDAFSGSNEIESAVEAKNIRRRVYDALNVLMAINIIEKNKKQIKWIGLPTHSNPNNKTVHINGPNYDHRRQHQQPQYMQRNSLAPYNGDELRRRMDAIDAKRKLVNGLLVQQLAFKNLVQRNKEQSHTNDKAKSDSNNESIQLPFIIVSTSNETQIDCEMADDGTEYFFSFNNKFDVYDEVEILKKMDLCYGLDTKKYTVENINKAKAELPVELSNYLDSLTDQKL